MDITDFHRNNQLGWYVEKDPDSLIDFIVDWGDWLTNNNVDTIAASTWIVPNGVTVDHTEQSGDFTAIWLGPSSAGARVVVTNRITTLQGRVQDQSFTVIVRDE